MRRREAKSHYVDKRPGIKPIRPEYLAALFLPDSQPRRVVKYHSQRLSL
jgi:hypothetical protein